MRHKAQLMMCRVREIFGRKFPADLERLFAQAATAFLCSAAFVFSLFAQTMATPNGTQSQPSSQPAAAPVVNPSRPIAPTHPAFLVIIDPAHGGSDSGARFTDKLLEKDITLAISRKLRSELQNRGIAAALLRDSDATLTYDQRAVSANAQRAGLYISVHVGTPGAGVRVYTALMPSDAEATPKKSTGPFIPWEAAQAEYLERSGSAAKAMVTEMNDAKIAAASAAAPLKPLNNVAAPAVAIEVAPPSADAKLDLLINQRYQQAIVTAVTNAIAGVRPKIEERRP